jgi:hypothetical protein
VNEAPGWSPPPERPRFDPWLVGLAIAAVLVVGLVYATSVGGSPATTTTTEPPPVGEAAILESARALTRAQEGLQVGPYHPAPESGVSIGYGYDMRERTPERVWEDLVMVEPPIDGDWVLALSQAAGLTGDEAQAFVDDHAVIFLTLDQADSLFDVTYREEAFLASEFATDPESHAFGVAYEPVVAWEALHPAIRGIVVDLKFRGDYRPWWTEQQPLQNAIAAGDPEGVLEAIRDPGAFPDDLEGSARFQARIDWLEWVLGSSPSS